MLFAHSTCIISINSKQYVLLDTQGPSPSYSNRYLSVILHNYFYLYFRQLFVDDRPHKTDVRGVLGVLHNN